MEFNGRQEPSSVTVLGLQILMCHMKLTSLLSHKACWERLLQKADVSTLVGSHKSTSNERKDHILLWQTPPLMSVYMSTTCSQLSLLFLVSNVPSKLHACTRAHDFSTSAHSIFLLAYNRLC